MPQPKSSVTAFPDAESSTSPAAISQALYSSPLPPFFVLGARSRLGPFMLAESSIEDSKVFSSVSTPEFIWTVPELEDAEEG